MSDDIKIIIWVLLSIAASVGVSLLGFYIDSLSS